MYEVHTFLLGFIRKMCSLWRREQDTPEWAGKLRMSQSCWTVKTLHFGTPEAQTPVFEGYSGGRSHPGLSFSTLRIVSGRDHWLCTWFIYKRIHSLPLVSVYFTWCHLKDLLVLLHLIGHNWDFIFGLYFTVVISSLPHRLCLVLISDIYVCPSGIYLYYSTSVCSAVHIYPLSY